MAVRLSSDDVGRRAVVRYLLPDGRATDVVGELVSWAGDTLQVWPDDGPAVAVPLASVVAAKPVPPRTVRPSSSPEAVQRVADVGWPGLERQRLGGWILRAGGGFTRRANSALAVGDAGVDADRALAEVERFYAARRLVPTVQVPFALDGPDDPAPGLDAELASRGWSCDAATLVMTARLPASGAVPAAVDVDPEPDDAWLGLYRYHGTTLPPVARDVLTAGPVVGFGSVRRDGRTVAVGRVAVASGWAGVTAMQTDDGHQRQGLGALMLGGLLAWGRERGARFAYLQVVADHAGAIALYSGAGFAPHHRYHYRQQPR